MKRSFEVLVSSVAIFSLLSAQCLRASAASGDKGLSLMYGSDETANEAHASEFVMRKYPGERLIPIRLLGGVRMPGTYYVPIGTDLLTILALSGGLNPSADSSKIIYSQWQTQSTSTLDLRAAMEEPAKRNPALSANDVLYVEESKPIVSNNAMLVLTVITSLLSIGVAATYLSKGH